MPQEPDWIALAKEFYRDVQLELSDRWSVESADFMIEYLKEEIREALLDMKQAVIREDAPDTLRYMREVRICMTELQQRGRGEL